ECYNVFQRKADRLIKAASPEAGLAAVIARRVGELGGVDGAAKQATAVFQSSEDLEGLFCRIARDELHELACRTLEESRPESWTDEMLQLLPMFPLSGCERESRNLAKAGRSDFEAGVETVFANPVACYEALLWLWNGPDLGEEFPQKPLVTTLSRLLRMLDEVRRSDQMDRELVKRIAVRARTVIAARKYERFNSCLDQIETPMASALKTQINRLDNLGRAVREDLLKLMREKFPNLEVKPETPAWEREDVLFVTQAGYMRKQDEVEHHVNVKMKENARAIGAAAEHGDLSENSEYKFALEERDLLRARLAQMNGEMAIAQVLDPEQVPTDYVGIGTRVEFKRVTDGESYTMTLVGPWESDPDAGKFNYRAPLAQKVLGANVGEVVEFEHGNAEGQYEIVALHNGLIDSDDADADVSSEQQTTHQ
ncbi:MAG: GreA/GreB family elongation factor, partial [Planctomycetota bacterium]